MTRDQLRSFYQDRIDSCEKSISHRTRLMNYISLLRLIVLVAAIYFLVLGIRADNLFNYAASLIMVVSFLVLVSYHKQHNDRRELFRQIKLLNLKERACLDHQYDHLPSGSKYIDHAHPWSGDLDLFGNGSLFQYLDRTATLRGSDQLALTLTTEPESIENIDQQQGIISDLKMQIEFRQKFTARANLIEEETSDFQSLSDWLATPTYIKKNPWLFYLAVLISGISLVVIITGFFHGPNFWYLLPVLLFNWGILTPFLMRTNRYQSNISRKHELLEGYAALLQEITAVRLTHPSLVIDQQIAKAGQKEVRRLSRLLNIFDQRLNMLLGVVFNTLFLFDFIMLYLLEKWKDRNREHIFRWIDLTARMDSLISLSGFAYNHPDYTQPEMLNGQAVIDLKDLGHPLIPERKRIDNHMRIDQEKVVIVTGANMAGKSTFLRALGINSVLAYAGCPVCASQFKSGFLHLHTSMRTADSLRDEESYFLAEIKRLQQIVKRMKEGKPILILLDEVLKGTNTTDKKRGSVGLIRKSLQYPVLCFIATHDLSLGELENDHKDEVINFCFESYIEDLGLRFDYTIRKGIAKNMNASFLMKQMGIMD